MKYLLALLAASALSQGAPATAQTIQLKTNSTEAGNLLLEFYLVPGIHAGNFDTIELFISGGPMNQLGPPGELVIQPSEDSGFSAFLTAPASFGGQGLAVFGVDASTDRTSAISGTFASLGSNEASNQGDYLLAQVVSPTLEDGLFFHYGVYDDGNFVAGGDALLPLTPPRLPEPGSLCLTCVALLSLSLRLPGCRRRA